MLFSYENKVTVVTGAGSGIGRAIATAFAQQGATVALLDLQKAAAEAATSDIRAAGGKAEAYACDVTNLSEVKAVINQVATTHGKIDALVNSAGVAHIGKLENTSEEDFERILRVNVKGTFHVMQAVIPHMKKAHQGVILNLASVAATLGISDRFAYSMSKGAVMSMTLSVAKDYVKDGIRCNCISPGRVHTPFVDGFLKANYPGKEKEMFEKLSLTQPIGRMAQPAEIAHFVVYLCSDEASFITGCDYPIDGGFTKLNS